MNIKITRLHKFDSGACEAICNVLFEDIGLVVNNVRIIRNKNDKLFASLPQEKYVDRQSGEERYKNLVAFPEKEDYFDFQHSMIHAYKEYIARLPVAQTPKDEIAEGTAIQTKFEDNLPF